MKHVLHIVDSRDYVEANCFQHQLADTLRDRDDMQLWTVAYDELHELPKATGSFDAVVSCLKQRTLFRHAERLKDYVGRTPIVVYDQDPWESFRDGSPFKGAYQHIASHLNVKSFAVTTQWWADYITQRGMPAMFVPMWVLPEYCDAGTFDNRNISLGFLGTIHAHRAVLFDRLASMGLTTVVRQSALPYRRYLQALSDIQVFIHSEDNPITIDGEPANLNVGLWIKDVEAAARGCFTIRNRAEGWETYLKDVPTALLYDDPAEVPSLLEGIRKMDASERQLLIQRTVEFIRRSDRWAETARLLTL